MPFQHVAATGIERVGHFAPLAVADIEFSLGVPRGEGGTHLDPRSINLAEPAPFEFLARLEHRVDRRQRLRIAVARDDAAILILDLGAPFGDLRDDHEDRLEKVDRLEAGDYDRLAIIARDEVVGSGSDNHADMAGTDKSVEPHVGVVEQRLDRLRNGDVIAEQREIVDSLLDRLEDRQRGRRHRRFETQREKDDFAPRIGPRDGERVERRIDQADIGPLGLGLEHALFRSRNAHRIAEGREDHLRMLGDFDAIIDPAHRQHAHRAAGAVDELDFPGHHFVQPVPEDRVGMAAADLHDIERLADGRRGSRHRVANLAKQPLGENGIAKFVGIFHRASPEFCIDASSA